MTSSPGQPVSGPFYLEDLYVGRRFVSGTQQLTTERIIEYARQYDPQPFHTDPVAAKDTFFKGLVASGWHTAAVSMRLLLDSGLDIAGGMIGAGVEIQWPQPTQPESIIHVEVEVLESRPTKSRPDKGIVKIRSETKTSTGEIVQVLTANLLVPRRNAAE